MKKKNETDSPSLQLWPLTVTNWLIIRITCVYIYITRVTGVIIFPFITVSWATTVVDVQLEEAWSFAELHTRLPWGPLRHQRHPEIAPDAALVE